jgi:hypothetical protein
VVLLWLRQLLHPLLLLKCLSDTLVLARFVSQVGVCPPHTSAWLTFFLQLVP